MLDENVLGKTIPYKELTIFELLIDFVAKFKISYIDILC